MRPEIGVAIRSLTPPYLLLKNPTKISHQHDFSRKLSETDFDTA